MDRIAIYYTDNRLDNEIAKLCQEQLNTCGIRIISVSLKPINFGEKNIVLPLQRGYLTMFKQILAGLETCNADIVFLCEHDILYHPSHFQFTPTSSLAYYYNANVWKVDWNTGHALFCDNLQQTSGLCASVGLLYEHYKKRVERVGQEGKYDYHIGFEPGTHSYPRGIDNYPAQSWMSEYPIIDIRHDHNLTPSRWSKDKFRNQKYTKGWTEAEFGKEKNTWMNWPK